MNMEFLIGAVITLLCALLASRTFFAGQKHKNKLEFKKPFLETIEKIIELPPSEYNNVINILKSSYPKQESAFINYSSTLDPVSRWFLKRKWLAYRGKPPEYPELPSEDRRYRFCHFLSKTEKEVTAKKEEVLHKLKKLIA